MPHRLLVIVLFFAVFNPGFSGEAFLLAEPGAEPGAEPVAGHVAGHVAGQIETWQNVKRRTRNLHLESPASLAEWVKQVDRPAQDMGGAMFKVAVLMKAGLIEDSIAAFEELKTFAPVWDRDWVLAVYGETCSDEANWQLSKAIVETFVESSAHVDLWRCTARTFVDAGWSLDEVDEWLAAREVSGGREWTKARLFYNIYFGRDASWARRFFAEQFGHRDDATAEALVGFVGYHSKNHWPRGPEPFPWQWLAEDLQPRSAVAAERLASKLLMQGYPREAQILYLKALEIPLDASEIPSLAGSQPFFSEGAQRQAATRRFVNGVQRQLARSYLESGDIEQSRRWIIEAGEKIDEPGSGIPSHLASQILAASEDLAVEERFSEHEVESAASELDWWHQAIHFEGLGDTARQEEALRRGLDLVRKEGPDAVADSYVYGGYLRFLKKEKRGAEIAEILRADLRDNAPSSKLASEAAIQWSGLFRNTIEPGEPVLWQWLSSFPDWRRNHWPVLRALIMAARRGDNFAAEVERARRIAESRGAQSLLELGLILHSLGVDEPAIAVLEAALAEGLIREQRFKAVRALYQAYLHSDRWQSAHALYPEVYGNANRPHRLSDLGVMAEDAAAQGFCEEGLKIWREVLTIDPAHTAGLKNLAAHGLGKDLRQLYLEMKEAIPASSIPDRALAILDGVRARQAQSCAPQMR